MMLRTIGCMVFAAFISTFIASTGFAAEETWIRTYINANGGCGPHRLLFNRLEMNVDVRGHGRIEKDLFGKPAVDWSGQDIDDAIDAYKKCEARLDARQKDRCMAGGHDEKRCDQSNQRTLQMAHRYELKLREIVSEMRERDGAAKRQAAAQAALQAAAALRKQKVAEEEVRREEERLLRQAARDKEAAAAASKPADAEESKITQAARQAEEAKKAREAAEARREEDRLVRQAARDKEAAAAASKLADVEEPKIAEIARQAEEARNAREVAEARLSEIRSRLNVEAKSNKAETDRARSADALREQALQQDEDRKATGTKTEPTIVEQLAHLLRGSPDPESLQKILDTVAVKYGFPATENSRRIVGNVLVAIQERNNVPGFEELTCMDELSPKVTTDMPTAAALCAAAWKGMQK